MKESCIILNKGDEHFEKNWNSYLSSVQHSFSYTLESMSYYHSYIQNIENKSFLVIFKNEVQAIVPLFIEKIQNHYSFSLANSYLPSPLIKNKKLENLIFSHINILAKKYNISQIKFEIDPTIDFLVSKNNFNPLKKYDFLETNNLTILANLELSKEELWSNIRSRYKTQINRYYKNSKNTLSIMDNKNSNWKHQEAYWNLHKIIAKDKARDIKLFKKQFELIKEKYATLFYIKNEKNEYISFSLFFHRSNSVLYASAVSKEDNFQEPLTHVMIWEAQKYFKNLNFKVMQFGEPSGFCKFTGLDDIQDDKQLAIAHFKRGMASNIQTKYRGIKFYDKSLLKNYLDNFYFQFKANEH